MSTTLPIINIAILKCPVIIYFSKGYDSMMIKSVATNHISLKGLEPGYRKLSVNCRKDNSTGRFMNGENINLTAKVKKVKNK